jgi:geranylgeranylglycerol-phosphate geranylgeranyltransferase
MKSNLTTCIGFARLFRVELPLTAGLCVVLGQLLALGVVPPWPTMAIGFASIFCISATALILNDVFDLEVDRVNAPNRPLPSGVVTPRQAIVLSMVVAASGLALSALLSPVALVTAFVVWVIGVLYNWRFKRSGLAGNLMVAFSVGMTFVFGGISVGRTDEWLVWWFGAIAFLLDLGEEIAADAMDAEGDRLIGSRSLAIVHGRAAALRVSAAIFGSLVVLGLMPFLLGRLDPVYLAAIGVMDLVILVSTVRLLDPTTARPRNAIRSIYLSGTFAVLVFISLRMTL